MPNLNTKQNDVEVFVRDVVVSFSVTGTVARLLLFSCMKKACHDMARQNEWTGKTLHRPVCETGCHAICQNL